MDVMKYNPTVRALRSLKLARQEADGLGHPHLGTEHILLGILCEADGVAARVLTEDFGISLEKAREAVIAAMSRGGPWRMREDIRDNPEHPPPPET